MKNVPENDGSYWNIFFLFASLLAARYKKATRSETDVFCVIAVHVNELSADTCDTSEMCFQV